jgi:restriction system protein
MSIPDFQTLFRPLLKFSGDGSEKNIKDAITALARQFQLTPEELEQLQPSGKQTIFANRVHWARTYLDKAGALRKTRRSHFQITERGKQLLTSFPDRIDAAILRQFPEFYAFQRPRSVDGIEERGTVEVPNATESSTPEEAIDVAEAEINRTLREQILERISELSPAFFERLVVDLIVAMGYGGGRQIVAQRLGRTGDQGIDGIVNEDPLGLDSIYIQAKRYDADITVGREKIQQFAGALAGQGASKGVFVTTSTFSTGALEYIQRIPQKIVLIDGDELARLMVQYRVGVRSERTIDLKRIDLDYFVESEV